MNSDIKKMAATFIIASEGCETKDVISTLAGLVCRTYQEIYPDKQDEQIMALNDFSEKIILAITDDS